MSPMPNHCIECDKPTMDIICDTCKEKEDNTKICGKCGEENCHCNTGVEDE